MPFQRLFTRRDQRVFQNMSKEELVTRASAFLKQAQFTVSFPGAYQLHAEQVYPKIGLRRVADVWVYESGNDVKVTLDISATLGDTEAAVGIIGAVLLLPVAVAVGAVSYMDYETDAANLMGSFWSYMYSATAPTTQQFGTLRCGNCGLELDPDAKFCKRCGAQVK
jgi:hypothetical protein